MIGSSLLRPEKVGWVVRASRPLSTYTLTIVMKNTWDASLLRGGFRLSWSLATSNVCGDGFRDALEACDDGNAVGGDGCSAACTREAGYVCAGGSSMAGPDTCLLPLVEASGSVQHTVERPVVRTFAKQWTISPSAAAGPVQVNLTAFNLVGLLVVFECLDPACTAQQQLPDPLAFNYTAIHAGRTLRTAAVGRPVRLVLSVSERNDVALNATRPCIVPGLFRVDWSSAAASAAACGNSFREAGEDCDDGNVWGGDGCSASCQVRRILDRKRRER